MLLMDFRQINHDKFKVKFEVNTKTVFVLIVYGKSLRTAAQWNE